MRRHATRYSWTSASRVSSRPTPCLVLSSFSFVSLYQYSHLDQHTDPALGSAGNLANLAIHRTHHAESPGARLRGQGEGHRPIPFWHSTLLHGPDPWLSRLRAAWDTSSRHRSALPAASCVAGCSPGRTGCPEDPDAWRLCCPEQTRADRGEQARLPGWRSGLCQLREAIFVEAGRPHNIPSGDATIAPD